MHYLRDVRNRFFKFGSVFEKKSLDSVWNEFGSVQKTWIGSDISYLLQAKNIFKCTKNFQI